MSKSHVSLEQHICVVCGCAFETNNVLLHKRLAQTLDHHTVTGYGMCPEHQKLKDDGFVALVECDPTKSAIANKDSANASVKHVADVYRTGAIAHVKSEVWPQIFNCAPPSKGLAFVEPGLIDKLQAMTSTDNTEGA